MSEIIRKINKYFRRAIKSDVDKITANIILSDRQWKIFEMFYLKKQNIGYIADMLGVCDVVISNELKIIREKISRVIDL